MSINDEMQQLRQIASQYNKTIVRVEKIGNPNMFAFQVWYKNPGDDTVHEAFFWQHAVEKLIEIFRRDAGLPDA